MKPREYPLMQECVETGVTIGLNRAFKHDEKPTPESIIENISREVMNEISTRWSFAEDSEAPF